MNNYSVKSSFTNIAKNFIWSLSRYEKNKKPVFLFAHRRGGSTLLMESIAAAGKYRYSDQPLSITSNSFNYLQQIPHPEHYRHISLDSETEQDEMTRFIDSIINGDKIVSAQWNPFRKGFHMKYDSSVLKLLNANPLIDWFIDKYPEASFIYLSRNPVNQSVSCMRNNWKLESRGFLNSTYYINKYVNDSQLEVLKGALNNENRLEAYVANWVLDAIPILSSKNKSRIKIVRYEDLVKDDEVKSELANELELNERIFIDFFKLPSKSSKKLSKDETLQKIKTDNYNPERLNTDIGAEEQKKIQNMLKEFDIDLYEI